jgi:hypothetical protein
LSSLLSSPNQIFNETKAIEASSPGKKIFKFHPFISFLSVTVHRKTEKKVAHIEVKENELEEMIGKSDKCVQVQFEMF